MIIFEAKKPITHEEAHKRYQRALRRFGEINHKASPMKKDSMRSLFIAEDALDEAFRLLDSTSDALPPEQVHAHQKPPHGR